MSRREWILTGVGVLGILVGLATLAWTLINYDGRQNIDLESFVDPPGLSLPGGRIATEDLCSEVLPCI